MCTGMEIAFLTATAVNTIGTLQQGKQQEKYYNWQAEQSRADAQAEDEAGQVRAEKIRKAGRYQVGEARAALSASGVAADVGTPLKITQQIERNVEEDALSELLTGTRKARRLESEASGYTIAGENALVNSRTKAAGSLLESGYQYGKWKGTPKK